MNNNIIWHGHRGCRGLMPENTIEAFLHALDFPVDAVEMDVVITRDQEILVSHEPYMSSKICLDPDGNIIRDELSHNIFDMDVDQIQKYDCGSLKLNAFPLQRNFFAYKPTFSQVFDKVESCLNDHKSLLYNIEAKSREGFDGIFHPPPDEFAQLLFDMIGEYQIKDRVIIQSFDFRLLRQLHKLDSSLPMAMLVDNSKTAEQNLDDLGFIPAYYSPKHTLISIDTKSFCEMHDMKLIAWTVNDIDEMKKLISIGVDDIITDYPNLISEVIV